MAEDLTKRGIKTSEAVMVGDKEWSDLTPAQKGRTLSDLNDTIMCEHFRESVVSTLPALEDTQ